MSALYLAPAAAAIDWESSSAVMAAARSVLPQSKSNVYTGSSPRTRGWIPACGHPLSAHITTISRWFTTVHVYCAKKSSATGATWSIYVPFQRSYIQNVVVARHFLPASVVIKRKDIRKESKRINAQSGSICTHFSEVIGQTLNAGVPSGYPLRPQNLLSPLLVRQGERVMLEARVGNVLVRTMGTALNNGRDGESLLVRNDTSRKVLTGVVAPDGAVLLTANSNRQPT